MKKIKYCLILLLFLVFSAGAYKNLFSAEQKKIDTPEFAYILNDYDLKARPNSDESIKQEPGFIKVTKDEKVKVILMFRKPIKHQYDLTYRWCYVRKADGQEGFIPNSFLSADLNPPSSILKAGHKFVKAKNLPPVYISLKIDENFKAVLPFRGEVQVLSDKPEGPDSMVKIKYKNITGYVESINLSDERPRLFYGEFFDDNFIMPVKGRITSTFGYRTDPLGGVSGEFHYGLDLAADEGIPISSVRHGKVIYTGILGGYGNCVMVDHEDGFETLYGHMSKIMINNGENVAQGQIIGKVGSTGRSTGNHLHFEVKSRNIALDPKDYLPLDANYQE